MLGDDVVDLADPETAPRARHPRFDARAFGAGERACIAASADPETTRWALWAAKEASYKALRRRDPAARFAPRRLRATLVAAAEARVDCGEARFVVTLHAAGAAIHAVAMAEGDAARVVRAVLELPSEIAASPSAPGDAARELARRTLAPILGVAEAALEVAKRDRAPELRVAGAPAALTLSLSHHGRFVSFAARLDGAARPVVPA